MAIHALCCHCLEDGPVRASGYCNGGSLGESKAMVSYACPIEPHRPWSEESRLESLVLDVTILYKRTEQVPRTCAVTPSHG